VSTPLQITRLGLLGFVGLVAIEHPLRPGLPPAGHFVSEYARGATRPVAVAAFVSWGVAMGASAALGWRRGERAVPGLLGAAALGTALCAGFITQTVAGKLPDGVARTTAGRLHDQGTLLIFAGLLLAAVWALRHLRTRRYRLGLLACAAAILAAPAILVAAGLDWPGVGQRAIILVGVAWLWLWATETERLSLDPVILAANPRRGHAHMPNRGFPKDPP